MAYEKQKKYFGKTIEYKMYQFKFLYKLIYRIHIFIEADCFSMGR
jgi:hypothetical protein